MGPYAVSGIAMETDNKQSCVTHDANAPTQIFKCLSSDAWILPEKHRRVEVHRGVDAGGSGGSLEDDGPSAVGPADVASEHTHTRTHSEERRGDASKANV